MTAPSGPSSPRSSHAGSSSPTIVSGRDSHHSVTITNNDSNNCHGDTITCTEGQDKSFVAPAEKAGSSSATSTLPATDDPDEETELTIWTPPAPSLHHFPGLASNALPLRGGYHYPQTVVGICQLPNNLAPEQWDGYIQNIFPGEEMTGIQIITRSMETLAVPGKASDLSVGQLVSFVVIESTTNQ
jgi:hypothetical protein